jgi:predicted nucleotidyltransferase
MQPKHTYAFLTGSRVYGVPNKDSDVDLVILVRDPKEAEKIASLGYRDTEATEYQCGLGVSVRFGNLNLIVLTDPRLYEVWREGTRILKRKECKYGLVTREEACALFNKLKKGAGYT